MIQGQFKQLLARYDRVRAKLRVGNDSDEILQNVP